MTKEEFDLNKGGHGSCSGLGLWSLLNRHVQVLPLRQLSWMLCPWPGVPPNIQSGTVQLLLKEAPLSSFLTPTTVLSAFAVSPGSDSEGLPSVTCFPDCELGLLAQMLVTSKHVHVVHTCLLCNLYRSHWAERSLFLQLSQALLLLSPDSLPGFSQSLASGALDSDRLKGPLLSPGPV